jgi:isopentenyl diphosphate isomerase/L-lactate dehydrogenase-like FMN-dependent dehydrogenase
LQSRDLSLSWETIDKLRASTKLKVVLKGILHPADAAIAADHCDAIYVSNHGGRQLDTVPATIELLPRIVAAVRQRNKVIPILIDGGIRTGSDIFKCLALGANFAFIGRPIAYALVKGESGVNDMILMLKDELRRCMILNGVNSVSTITSEYIGYRSAL